jgi:excinuclease UvrABC helicase subunit UvrB
MTRRIFRINFENLPLLRSEDLVESEVLLGVLKKEVPKAINKAIKEKKTYATVFEINSSNVYVEIHKKDWVNALNSCVEFHAKEEEYETCVELNNTIKSLTKNKQTDGRVERV